MDELHDELAGLDEFLQPDPADPNDYVRQKTQSREPSYPYDRPISYGREKPGIRARSVWENISQNYGPGPEADDAVMLGYGNHGRMGEDGLDALELELDSLKRDFLSSYEAARPTTDSMDSPALFSLLNQLDPEFAAETFAPEDENEMRDVYGLWASRVLDREG